MVGLAARSPKPRPQPIRRVRTARGITGTSSQRSFECTRVSENYCRQHTWHFRTVSFCYPLSTVDIVSDWAEDSAQGIGFPTKAGFAYFRLLTQVILQITRSRRGRGGIEGNLQLRAVITTELNGRKLLCGLFDPEHWHAWLLARPRGSKRHVPMMLTVGPADGLFCTAEMEI